MSNNQLTVCNVTIRQDAEGRYFLNDLHKAAGGHQKDRPKYFLENKETQALIATIIKKEIPPSCKINNLEPVKTVNSFTEEQGTYVVKPLVYAYAMWISPEFQLHVINAYDALVTGTFKDTLTEFLKPITETITLRDFEWRKQVIYQAFENLEKAQVETMMIISGQELLARTGFEK